MRYDFYAYMDRMKYIKRWQLMRSTREENIMEHSHGVTMLAHALATIRKEVFQKDVDVLKVVLYAVYHETSEVITGDLPTPIKYYNQGIHGAYKDLEKKACEKMVSTLPPEMQSGVAPFVLADEDSEEYKLVKCADRLSAYIKCLEELKSGNTEFSKAKKSIEADLHARGVEEVEYFFTHFIPSYSLSLDELDNEIDG
ncbi:MAG: 5'-deoxynucleotidase [Clostridia bacterium]|nr:5'-deoxynucleotidase [Clostridia bacterium]